MISSLSSPRARPTHAPARAVVYIMRAWDRNMHLSRLFRKMKHRVHSLQAQILNIRRCHKIFLIALWRRTVFHKIPDGPDSLYFLYGGKLVIIAVKDDLSIRFQETKISDFAFRMPSLDFRFSRWQRPIFVITQMSGLAIFARRCISPKSEIPISTTAA